MRTLLASEAFSLQRENRSLGSQGVCVAMHDSAAEMVLVCLQVECLLSPKTRLLGCLSLFAEI